MTSPCGMDTVREPIAAGKRQKKVNEMRTESTRPFALFMATLREIFEESAYERFLARAQVKSSPAAYGNFLRETEGARARRPKCC